jgi:hypothetical protein
MLGRAEAKHPMPFQVEHFSGEVSNLPLPAHALIENAQPGDGHAATIRNFADNL